MLHRNHVIIDDEVAPLTVKVTCSTGAPSVAVGVGDTVATCTLSAPETGDAELADPEPVAAQPRDKAPVNRRPTATGHLRSI